MPVSFLGLPKLQYFDNNGVPLSGGKLYSYSPGTTTNKATYPTIADAKASTNANANPVILDSRGEADVVLAGQTKLVLTDSSDVTIWTLDNVNGDSDFLDANGDEILVFSEASSPVNHLQISNAASGAAPKLSGVGDDANVSIEIEAKAAGNVVLDPGTSGDVVVELSSILLATGEGIKDSGGDELLMFTEDSTPVNYLNITSGDTAVAPILEAAGSDSNIDFDIKAKGTGTIDLSGAAVEIDNGATGPGEVRLLEDSDNGSNYMGFKAPSTVTASLSLELPDGDGTSGQYLSTNASGVLSWSTVTQAASQAQQETGSATNVYVSPGRQQYHESACKAWIYMDGSGVVAINGSYNITSIVDNGTGDYTVNIATDFSDANFAVAGLAGTSGSFGSANTDNFIRVDAAPAAGTFEVQCGTTVTAATDADLSHVYLVMFGDQ